MLLIIQLQGLPLSTNALDIRNFFDDLYIPRGGVRIIGGEKGIAYIKFITDEDARRALLLNNTILHGAQVHLFLSSQTELQNAIDQEKTCVGSAPVSASTTLLQVASNSTMKQQIEPEPMKSVETPLAHNYTIPCATQQPQPISQSSIPAGIIATTSLLNDATSSCLQSANTCKIVPEQAYYIHRPTQSQQSVQSGYAVTSTSMNAQNMINISQGHGYVHNNTIPCATQQPQQNYSGNIPAGILATNSCLLNLSISSCSQRANTRIIFPEQAYYTRRPAQNQQSVQSGYAITDMSQSIQNMPHTHQGHGYEGPAKQADIVQKNQIDQNFAKTINRAKPSGINLHEMLSSSNETYRPCKPCGTVNQIDVDCHNPVYFSAIMTTRDKHVQSNVSCGYPNSFPKRSLSSNARDEGSRPLKKLNIEKNSYSQFSDAKSFAVRDLNIAEATPMPGTNAPFHSNSSNVFPFLSAFGAQAPASDGQQHYVKGNLGAPKGRSVLWNHCEYRAPSVYNDFRKEFQNVNANDMRGLMNAHFPGTQDWHNMRASRDVKEPTNQCIPQNSGERQEHPNLQYIQNQRTFIRPRYRHQH